MSDVHLDLPPVVKFRHRGDVQYYGAMDVAADYCGLHGSALPSPRGLWQHGWIEAARRLAPECLFGIARKISTDQKCWVATAEDERFLRANGFNNVTSIGLPIAYVSGVEVSRIPESLLVVPVHSQKESDHEWHFQEYVDEIDRIKDDFKSVCVCVHPYCWEKGYWVNAFQERGYQVVPGAAADDQNGLRRVASLFSQFEFVTTNGYGSHLVYSAYLGAKPSIYGTYAQYRLEDYLKVPFYAVHTQIRKQSVEAMSERAMSARYPNLFVPHPRDALLQQEWGESQVGIESRVSPMQMKREFGWDLGARFGNSVKNKVFGVADTWLPDPIKSLIRRNIYSEFRRKEAFQLEIDRLAKLPRDQPGETSILGFPLRFTYGKSCAYQLDSIFRKQVYRFDSKSECPLIIDGGANLGLASIYFAREYPEAEVIAFEPDPDVFHLLTKNLLNIEPHNVQLECKALWTSDSKAAFHQEGSDAGRLVPADIGRAIEVQTVRLREILEHRTVDFLKLDVEGAEVELLQDCQDVLENVNALFVEYHSEIGEPQQAAEIFDCLRKAGFRVHVHSPNQVNSPFIERSMVAGYDLLLEIFAFRE